MPRPRNPGPCIALSFQRQLRNSTVNEFGQCSGSFLLFTRRCFDALKPEFQHLLSEKCVGDAQLCEQHYSLFINRFESKCVKPENIGRSSENLLHSPKRLKVGNISINFKQGKDKVFIPTENFNTLLSHVDELEKFLSQPSISESVNFCVNFLYKRKTYRLPDIYSWDELLSVIEKEDSSGKCKRFLLDIYDSCKPLVKDEKTRESLKKRVISIFYQWMYATNKHLDHFQQSMGLRSVSKITTEAMRSLHVVGITPPPQSVNRIQHGIAARHSSTVSSFIFDHSDNFLVINLDDYTDIWEKREPEEVQVTVRGELKTIIKTHNVNLMATCIAKPIVGEPPVICDPLNFGEIQFESYQSYLSEQATFLSIPYEDWKKLHAVGRPITQARNEDDDLFERLTTHHYDTSVQLPKQARSMRGVKLLDCFEQHLKSLTNYKEAYKKLSMLHDIAHQKKLLVVVPDYPGNAYTRKLHFQRFLNPPLNTDAIFDRIISFIGPLHVSLNVREMVVKKFVSELWIKFYRSIFGEGKKLAKKPKPWRITLILELAHGGWLQVRKLIRDSFTNCCDAEYAFLINLLDELVPASLDIYATFYRANDLIGFLHCLLRLETLLIQPMRRKNYLKITPAFISDVIYWQSHPPGHPFRTLYDRLLNHFVYFNDWFVEGFHAQIRRRTNPGADPKIVQQQAYTADYDNNHDNDFEAVFNGGASYPYTPHRIRQLFVPAAKFWVDLFRQIKHNLGSARRLESANKTTVNIFYFLPTLDCILPVTCMPAAFSHKGKEPNPTVDCFLENCVVPVEYVDAPAVVFPCLHRYHVACVPHLTGPNFTCGVCHNIRLKTGLANLKTFDSWLRAPDAENDPTAEPLSSDDEDDGDDNGDAHVSNATSILNISELQSDIRSWSVYERKTHLTVIKLNSLTLPPPIPVRTVRPKAFKCPVVDCTKQYVQKRVCNNHPDSMCVPIK
eukprot:Pompholyxophrys_sp_v1_NODE_39_length_3310_cov_8.940707.p1 type:complete len:958 gc:universal NODE_39_length_3310_cov_8.940707:3085-212(-)